MHMADLCVLENTLFKCFHKINYDKCADLSENGRCRWMQKCDGGGPEPAKGMWNL